MLPSKHKNNRGDAVSAKRDNSYFFMVSGREQPLVYHVIFRNLTSVRALFMDGLMTHPLSVSSFLQYLYVPKWTSSEENVINVMSYLCSQSKVDTAHILPAETVCSDSGVQVPQG